MKSISHRRLSEIANRFKESLTEEERQEVWKSLSETERAALSAFLEKIYTEIKNAVIEFQQEIENVAANRANEKESEPEPAQSDGGRDITVKCNGCHKNVSVSAQEEFFCAECFHKLEKELCNLRRETAVMKLERGRIEALMKSERERLENDMANQREVIREMNTIIGNLFRGHVDLQSELDELSAAKNGEQ